jgi:ubiquinone/menaquinone biosynthesis C-methylase UbiE
VLRLSGACSTDEVGIVSYFGAGMDARRYARARPYVHSTAIDRFRSFAQIDAPLSLALDVGCGTGHSTIVLTDIAERVIAVDPSEDMLKQATPHPNVEYRKSTAEDTPFQDDQFDLITAAQAFHWLDREAFLAEAFRLLRVPGWLLIYTSWFTGEMKGEPAFSAWFTGEYMGRYPSPPRDRAPITEELAQRHGLAFRGNEEFRNEVGMTVRRFTDYQLSTSNIIAAVEQGVESFDGADQWIRASISRFFGEDLERIFLFRGKSWYLAKASA